MTFDITHAETWIPVVSGVILPFLVALVAHQKASGLVKAGLAAVGAGLSALIVYLQNDSLTWQGAVSAFLLAVIVAAGTRVTVTGGADDKLAAAIPGGIGKPAYTTAPK